MLECKYAGVRVIFIFCSSGIIIHTSFGQISKDEIFNSEVLISRIGRNVDTSLGHYICQFYHMITLILLVIIFILRKLKIITTELVLILLIVLLALDISPVLVIMFVCWAVKLHLLQMDVKHLQYPV